MNKVKMYWWNDQPNFGDALNPIIVRKLFGIEPVWSPLATAKLVGAGSCLQWVAKTVIENPHEMHIWGTGYIFDQEPAVDSSLVFHHAVRGRKSLDYGSLSGISLGDPGILASLLMDKPTAKRYAVGIVPHLWNMRDKELEKVKDLYPNVKIINVTEPPLNVVTQIASCDFIFSSSLHGLIVADSFGIPNQWVTFDKVPFGGNWKFDDYYSNYELKDSPMPVRFDAQFVKLGLLDRLSHFEERHGVREMQDSLLSSFPRNLAD